MSVEALEGARAVTAQLKGLIAQLPTEDPNRSDRRARRPQWQSAALVHLVLADRHRVDREGGPGAARESVEQLAAQTGLSLQVVRRSLDSLHDVGVWTRGKRGGPGSPTERIPGFPLGNSAPAEGLQSKVGPPQNSAPTEGAQIEGAIEPNSAPIAQNSAPIGRNSAPPVGATPPTTTSDHHPERGSAESLVRCRAEEVPSLLAGAVVVHGQAAVDRAVQRLVESGATFTFPSKLIDAVSALIVDEGFDLAAMADSWRSPIGALPTYELVAPEDEHAGPTVRVIYEEAAP